MSVWKHKRGGWYLQLNIPGGGRARLYLGRMSTSQAKWIDERVLDLQQSRQLAMPCSPLTTQWIGAVSGSMREWLVEIGLIEARAVRNEDNPR